MAAAPAYDWYQRGMALLQTGDVHAAATLLERAADAEPGKSSIHEALARAYFRAGRFAAALEQFTRVLEISPANDYALFGSGLCLGRLGRLREAVGQLRMANVMRPDNADYEDALAQWERHLASFHPTTDDARDAPPGEVGPETTEGADLDPEPTDGPTPEASS